MSCYVQSIVKVQLLSCLTCISNSDRDLIDNMMFVCRHMQQRGGGSGGVVRLAGAGVPARGAPARRARLPGARARGHRRRLTSRSRH